MSSNEYKVSIETPMGAMDSTVVAVIDGTSLSGMISFMGKDNDFTGGTIDEHGKLSFTGALKTPIGKMDYIITGTLVDGVIDAVAKTKMGDLKIKSK